eukprot:6188272-Pleurochrysis_carterae.AAC.2
MSGQFQSAITSFKGLPNSRLQHSNAARRARPEMHRMKSNCRSGRARACAAGVSGATSVRLSKSKRASIADEGLSGGSRLRAHRGGGSRLDRTSVEQSRGTHSSKLEKQSANAKETHPAELRVMEEGPQPR